MHLILKTTLAATFCLIGSAGLLAAQTATTKTVVGMTAGGDQVVKEVTSLITSWALSFVLSVCNSLRQRPKTPVPTPMSRAT